MNSLNPLHGKKGFTLIELLVSMAILSLMLISMATVMGYVSKLWLNGIGAMDNFSKARVVLNLLDRDIQMMVMRRDVAAFVDGSGNKVDANGNAICEFYTNIQGGPATGASSPDFRTVSLVQYVLSTPGTTPTLQRLNYGINFPPVAPLMTPTLLMSIGNTTSLPVPSNAALETETVFTGIIRFQIQFLDGTGTITSAYNFPPASFSPPIPPTSSRSVVVSMLVLSNSAYNLATRNGGTIMTTLLSDFPNPTTPTAPYTTYSQYWNSILNPTIGTLDPNLPPQVRGGIQVFERHIPLPITTPSS